MKTIYFFAALCLLMTTNVFAQQDSAAMMKAWMAYMTPGPEHQHMALGDGEWTTEASFWEKPGDPPKKSSGSCVNKMIMGGRYCQSKYNGDMMGMPFEGLGIMAYDNARKMYVSTWIDNMGTGIMNMEGKWNDDLKALELTGEMDDPITGKHVKLRQVEKWQDNDHHTMEMYRMSDGQEVKEMEIVFTRK